MAQGTTMPFPALLACLLQAPKDDDAEAEDDDEMAFYTKSTSVWAGQNLYLAQSPIFERAQKGEGGSPPAPPPLAALAEHIDRLVD